MLRVKQTFERIFTLDYHQTFPWKEPPSNPWVHVLPWGGIVLYISILLFLPPLMKKIYRTPPKRRDPSKKKVLSFMDKCMVAWNFFLSFSSVLMIVFGFIPFIRDHIFKRGFMASFCDIEGRVSNEPSVMLMWVCIFIMYKFVELVDTVFLIVKNPWRKIRLLHWYHHITVLLVSYYAFYSELSLGVWFGMVNATVHSFMYYYYAMAILGKKPKWAFLLTMGQIAQMFLGCIFTGTWAGIVWSGRECYCRYNPNYMIASFGTIYSSYLALFIQFAFGRYSGKPKGGKRKMVEKADENVKNEKVL